MIEAVEWVLRETTGRARGLSGRAQLFGSAVCFGLMAALARRAALAGFGSGQLTFVRFLAGAAFCLALFAARPGTFRPRRKGLLAVRGLAGGISVLCYFAALARIPAGEATLLNYVFPILTTLFATFTLGERPTLHLALAIGAASLGVVLVLGGGHLPSSLGWGEVAGILSAVFSAIAVTSIRALRPTDNAPTIFFAFCVGGALVSLPFVFTDWPADWAPWLWAAAASTAAVGAQLLMTEALGSVAIPEAAVWQQLTPVMSYLFALPLLAERVSGGGAIGVLLVVGGVAWGAALGGRPAARTKG